MRESLLIGLASVIVLGIGAQWLAWRFRLPSILLLLLVGFLAGPITGLLDPDSSLGDLLFPIVSLSVAVILFEGSLSLKLAELRTAGRVIRNLVTIGALFTWMASSAAAHLIVGLEISLSVLLGAILVVTGPTVIMPLLRHIRPAGRVASVLRWEGIIVDPVGAMLAVLVFEVLLSGGFREATSVALSGVVKTIIFGGIAGILGAGVLVLVMRRYWVPDFLHAAVTLSTVFVVFTISNELQTESGLLAVTAMGATLANQKIVPVKHIVEFKENLRVLLLAMLFILLSARVQLSVVNQLDVRSLAFLVVLIFFVRPLTVVTSTLGSTLSWKERILLSWVAPRGVVAAAVSSVFSLRLVEAGYPLAELLVPLTFLVIVGTVGLYGLTAGPVARWLMLSKANPQGVLIVGAHPWAQSIARVLQSEGIEVMLVDTNRWNVSAARLNNLKAYDCSILSEEAREELELEGIGKLISLTPNDEVNSLAGLHFMELFGRSEIYQLPFDSGDAAARTVSRHLTGRYLFGAGMTYTYLTERFAEGATVKKTKLSPEFDYAAFRSLYGDRSIPLFLITQSGELLVMTAEDAPTPKPGHALISIVAPAKQTSLSVNNLS